MPTVSSQPTERHLVDVAGNQLDVAIWGVGAPSLVFLHEGLGSIDGWKGVPAAVAVATGETVLAYDRAGHGRSTPVPTAAWPTRWLHDEAVVLGELINHVGASEPLLVGHSDGGSIALIAAAERRCRPRALLTLAAHSWVETICFDAIVGMREHRDAFVKRLSRTHAHPQAVFDAWSGVWVSDDFQTWDIRPDLHAIECPALIAQGSEDEYATPAHAAITADAIGTRASSTLIPGLGHVLHHQDEQAIIDVIVRYVDQHPASG